MFGGLSPTRGAFSDQVKSDIATLRDALVSPVEDPQRLFSAVRFPVCTEEDSNAWVAEHYTAASEAPQAGKVNVVLDYLNRYVTTRVTVKNNTSSNECLYQITHPARVALMLDLKDLVLSLNSKLTVVKEAALRQYCVGLVQVKGLRLTSSSSPTLKECVDKVHAFAAEKTQAEQRSEMNATNELQSFRSSIALDGELKEIIHCHKLTDFFGCYLGQLKDYIFKFTDSLSSGTRGLVDNLLHGLYKSLEKESRVYIRLVACSDEPGQGCYDQASQPFSAINESLNAIERRLNTPAAIQQELNERFDELDTIKENPALAAEKLATAAELLLMAQQCKTQLHEFHQKYFAAKTPVKGKDRVASDHASYDSSLSQHADSMSGSARRRFGSEPMSSGGTPSNSSISGGQFLSANSVIASVVSPQGKLGGSSVDLVGKFPMLYVDPGQRSDSFAQQAGNNGGGIFNFGKWTKK